MPSITKRIHHPIYFLIKPHPQNHHHRLFPKRQSVPHLNNNGLHTFQINKLTPPITHLIVSFPKINSRHTTHQPRMRRPFRRSDHLTRHKRRHHYRHTPTRPIHRHTIRPSKHTLKRGTLIELKPFQLLIISITNPARATPMHSISLHHAHHRPRHPPIHIRIRDPTRHPA